MSFCISCNYKRSGWSFKSFTLVENLFPLRPLGVRLDREKRGGVNNRRWREIGKAANSTLAYPSENPAEEDRQQQRKTQRETMNLVVGGSCFLHPPLRHPQLLSPFSPSSSQCALLYMRNAEKQRKHRVPMASLHEGDKHDAIFCGKRVVLFVGFSVLPLLSSRARAVQDPVTGKFWVFFCFPEIVCLVR